MIIDLIFLFDATAVKNFIPFSKQTNFNIFNFPLIMAVKLNYCLGFDIINY